jgi:hypothetical protein
VTDACPLLLTTLAGSAIFHRLENMNAFVSSLSPVQDWCSGLLVRTCADGVGVSQVYRTALAGSPDNSVWISSIGFTTNLEVLLKSPPDSVSPLSGHDLVAAKVHADLAQSLARIQLKISPTSLDLLVLFVWRVSEDQGMSELCILAELHFFIDATGVLWAHTCRSFFGSRYTEALGYIWNLHAYHWGGIVSLCVLPANAGAWDRVDGRTVPSINPGGTLAGAQLWLPQHWSLDGCHPGWLAALRPHRLSRVGGWRAYRHRGNNDEPYSRHQSVSAIPHLPS